MTVHYHIEYQYPGQSMDKIVVFNTSVVDAILEGVKEVTPWVRTSFNLCEKNPCSWVTDAMEGK